MYRTVCSNQHSVNKSVDIEDDDDDEDDEDDEETFTTFDETLAYLFFSIVSNFKCFCNLYLRTIQYVLCHKE